MEVAGFEFKPHLHPHAGTYTPLYLSTLAHSNVCKLQFTPIDTGALKWPCAHKLSPTYTFCRPPRSRRWKTWLFFYEQIAVLCWRVRLHLHARTHVRTHMHMGLPCRHSLRANVSAAILAVAALIIFIYAFSNTEGVEREMREAWIQLLLCIHSPTSSWIPVAWVRDAGVFLCKFRVEYVFLLLTRMLIKESHQSRDLHTDFFLFVLLCLFASVFFFSP